jgi:hypothetical protein
MFPGDFFGPIPAAMMTTITPWRVLTTCFYHKSIRGFSCSDLCLFHSNITTFRIMRQIAANHGKINSKGWYKCAPSRHQSDTTLQPQRSIDAIEIIRTPKTSKAVELSIAQLTTQACRISATNSSGSCVSAEKINCSTNECEQPFRLLLISFHQSAEIEHHLMNAPLERTRGKGPRS